MYVNSTSCVGINVIPDTTKQTTYIGKEANDKGTSFDDTAVVYSKSQMTTADGTVSVKGVSSDATTSTYAVSSTATTSTTTDYLKSLGTPTVNEVQQQLAFMGYYSGAINGKSDSAEFINAVNKFQSANGMINTTVVDKITYNAIQSSYSKKVQSYMKELGFYTGSIDGNLKSAGMIKSIKLFQEVYGVSKTGTVNSASRDKLKSAYMEYQKCMANTKLSTYLKSEGLISNVNNIAKKNFAKIWSFLKVSMGLGDRSASGVMGNIMLESHFSPTNASDQAGYPGIDNGKGTENEYTYKSDDGVAYGILQWCWKERKEGLKEKAQEYSMDVGDMNIQLAFFRKEMISDYSDKWNVIKSQEAIDISTGIFFKYVESPDDDSYEIRYKYAKAIYAAMTS